jgi:hypothetical protein
MGWLVGGEKPGCQNQRRNETAVTPDAHKPIS